MFLKITQSKPESIWSVYVTIGLDLLTSFDITLVLDSFIFRREDSSIWVGYLSLVYSNVHLYLTLVLFTLRQSMDKKYTVASSPNHWSLSVISTSFWSPFSFKSRSLGHKKDCKEKKSDITTGVSIIIKNERSITLDVLGLLYVQVSVRGNRKEKIDIHKGLCNLSTHSWTMTVNLNSSWHFSL